MGGFKFFPQLESMDCGPACLQMITAHHGKTYSLEFIRTISDLGKMGTNFESLSYAAHQLGLSTTAVQVPFHSKQSDIPGLTEAPLPCVVYWNQKHFVVVHKIKGDQVYIADPADTKRKLDKDFFIECWNGGGDEQSKGFVLLFMPNDEFGKLEEPKRESRSSLQFILKYVEPFKWLMFQVLVGLVLVSFLQLIYPFLTQSIVDIGIANKDLNFIFLILIGQLSIFLGRTTIEVIRSWIMLHIGSRLNISVLTDFLGKLMRLPIRFFDARLVGDIFQRVNEVSRIEVFLTGQSFNALFSVMTLLIFGVVLYIYDSLIFLIFFGSAIVYAVWILLFLKRRKKIDYQMFSQFSTKQSSLLEMVQGMPEIKLHNSEAKKQSEWEDIQIDMFKIQMRSLTIDQWQRTGASIINELKDIIISIIAAKAVIEGNITLGMMLAIQYIIGNLNGPLLSLVEFVKSTQNATISLDRFVEVFRKDNEEGESMLEGVDLKQGNIELQDVTFSYEMSGNPVLKNIHATFPRGKITAIVGASGSGKTTLVKLLLKFYEPIAGKVRVGNHELADIRHTYWRKHCGAVLQDGHIFSDSLAYNIGLSDDEVDPKRLQLAADIANINDFAQGLPLKFDTKIGEEGQGLSQGQKQRVLIARAVYKDPDILFFDEATNALDATNERGIMEKLEQFFTDRTVIIVAHRLSTVKNADQILVLDQGIIAEQGDHASLTERKGLYYNLVKNQLEMGN